MKTICLWALVFASSLMPALAQPKLLTSDPLTGLPVIPATEAGKDFGNAPTQMPEGQICKSKMKGNFYSLFDIKMDAVIAWYASHLSGFKKVQGFESGRIQVAFYNADETILVILTGNVGAKGENTDGYSVAYERYQPGLSEKTISGILQGKIICQ
jgi:hypothetical protein